MKAKSLFLKNHIPILIALFLLSVTVRISGQETKPDAGAKLGNSYSVGQFDTINTTNGNLMMQFPLGSVAGRGQAAAGIGLFYNSKLYSTRRTKVKDERYECDWEELLPCQYYYKTLIEQNPKGGWNYGKAYTLEGENRLDSSEVTTRPYAVTGIGRN